MKNTLIKLVVLILVIKEVWLLLGVPSVANALVSFLMVGAVPGTNTTLSPDEVYRLLAVVFVLMACLIFRKEIMRLFRRRPAVASTDVAAAADETVAVPLAMPIPHPMGNVTPISRDPVEPTESKSALRAWMWRFGALLMLLQIHIVLVSKFFWAAAMRAAKWLIAHVRVAVGHAIRISIWTSKYIARQSVVLWRAVEPYLRRFDKWLEKKLHQYEKTATILSVGSEMSATSRKWIASAWASLREANAVRQQRK